MKFESLKFKLTDNKAYPKYMQLRDQLEQFIREKHLAADTQLPDILTLCSMSGLSNRSVERACQLLISDGVCYRRPKKGTFVCGENKAPLVKLPRFCGILNPPNMMHLEQDQVFGRIYNGIQEEAVAHGIDLVIMSEQSLPSYIRNFGDNFLGVLLLGWEYADSASRLVKNYQNTRFIFVNDYLQNFSQMPENVSGIFNDDFAGGFSAAEFLHARKCRHPLVLSLDLPHDNYLRRIQGFCGSMEQYGIQIEKDMIKQCTRPYNSLFTHEVQYDWAHKCILDCLSQKKKIDCVFCVNDLLAAGVAATLVSHGLNEKIRVVGYDNIVSYLSKDGHFSTLSINQHEMGRKAIAMLLTPDLFPRILNIPPQFIPRELTFG